MQMMIADREFSYRGVRQKVGDRFEADDEHVELFTRIGHAHVADGSLGYGTRMMTAVTSVATQLKRPRGRPRKNPQ